MANRRRRRRKQAKAAKPNQHKHASGANNTNANANAGQAAAQGAGVGVGVGADAQHAQPVASVKAPPRPATFPGQSLWQKDTLQSNIFLGLALCVMIAVSYFPSVWAGLVWDDVILVKAKPIHEWGGLWQMWSDHKSLILYEGHYWPVLYTTFWLEYKIWGLHPLGYHVVNLVLHAMVTLLLWRLLLSPAIKIGAGVSWLVAALFAIHPFHAESVIWVIGRKDVLSTLFYLWAIWCYVQFIQFGKPKNYWISVGLFLCSMLSKSVSVTLPAVLLLWHWWRRGRITFKDLILSIPYFTVGLTISIWDWWLYKGKESVSFDISLIERAFIAARGSWFYASKVLFPVDLAVVYPRWEMGVGDVIGWVYLLAAGAVVVALWKLRKSVYVGRGGIACVLFFVITLSPTLGFVDYGYMQFAFVADRYQYLGGTGTLVLLSFGLVYLSSWLLKTHPLRIGNVSGMQIILGLTTLSLFVVMGSLTARHATIYKNDGTFFGHVIEHNPKARGGHHNYGNWLQKQGKVEEALAIYEIAVEKRPNYASIHNKIGTAMQALKRSKEAEESYRRALAIEPSLNHARNNLALLLTQDHRYNEAIALYRDVLKRDSNYVNAHIGMGTALFNLQRTDEALRSINRALELDPSSEAAHKNHNMMLQLLEQKKQDGQ